MNEENELEAGAMPDVSLLTIQAVAEVIQDFGEITSGKLYAQLTNMLKLHDCQQAISALKRVGLVAERPGQLLCWNGHKSK